MYCAFRPYSNCYKSDFLFAVTMQVLIVSNYQDKFLYPTQVAFHTLPHEFISPNSFEPLLLMLVFGIIGSVPMLIIARLISPRRKFSNPVKFLPMECGQVPSGEGRTHFMMQYYSYVLMFVVFDVMAIFLYAWGSSIFGLAQTATLPIIAFLGVLFAAMGYAMYLSGRKDIW